MDEIDWLFQLGMCFHVNTWKAMVRYVVELVSVLAYEITELK